MNKLVFLTSSLLLLICSCKEKQENIVEKSNKKVIEKNFQKIQLKNIKDSICENDIYMLAKEEDCDLNNDKLIDKILIFDLKEGNLPNSGDSKCPIMVLINEKTKYQINYNNTIFPSRFNDGFYRLVIKENYFTIELKNYTLGISDVTKYLTFKFNKIEKDIFVYKYGEIINWIDEDGNEKDSPTKIFLDEKKIGKINFNKFEMDLINNLTS